MSLSGLSFRENPAKVIRYNAIRPVSTERFLAFVYGQVAQLVEHRTENPGVAGSIPALSTCSKDMPRNHLRGFLLLPPYIDYP